MPDKQFSLDEMQAAIDAAFKEYENSMISSTVLMKDKLNALLNEAEGQDASKYDMVCDMIEKHCITVSDNIKKALTTLSKATTRDYLNG